MSRTALVSQDARTRPVAQRAAVEAQIPTEVLCQDPSRSAVHREGGAGEEAMSIPRRNVHRAENRGWPRPDSRSATTEVENVPRRKTERPESPCIGLQLDGEQSLRRPAEAQSGRPSSRSPLCYPGLAGST